jgi:hypothetical protein
MLVNTFKSFDDRLWNVSFLNQGPSQPDDHIHRFDIPGATESTGFACGAIPQLRFFIQSVEIFAEDALEHQPPDVQL